MHVTPRLIQVVNRTGTLADELGSRSEAIADLSTSPRMQSVLLFRRLRSNLRGYMMLWQDGLFLEADILLRCMVEATICLAANATLGDEFVALIRSDAAATLKGTIKIWRGEGFDDLVRDGEQNLRKVFGQVRENGSKHAQLNWADLAQRSGQHSLYGLHRMLSVASAHITGLSLMRGVVGIHGEGEKEARRFEQLGETVNFASMASVLALACRLHGQMIDATDLLAQLDEIETELNIVGQEAAH